MPVSPAWKRRDPNCGIPEFLCVHRMGFPFCAGFILNQPPAGVYHNNHSKHHQENGDDELKPFRHKHGGAGSKGLYKSDGSLDKGCKRNAKHDGKRREQRPVLTSRHLEEYAERNQDEGA